MFCVIPHFGILLFFSILRVRNTDAPDASAVFPCSMLLLKNNLYSSSPTAPAVKWGSSKVHAPVPFRPQPLKSQKFAQSWHLPDNPDWVTMSIIAEEGTVIHHNPNMVQMPAKIHNTPSQSAEERVLNAHRIWTNLNPAMRCNSDIRHQRSQSEQDEGDQNPEGTMRPRLTSVSEPNQSWEAADTKDSVSVEAVDNDGPLDLSESGRAKAKTLEEAPDSVVSLADSPRSTSSSSPPAPSSSSVGSTGSQSEQKLEELIWQVRNIKLAWKPNTHQSRLW